MVSATTYLDVSFSDQTPSSTLSIVSQATSGFSQRSEQSSKHLESAVVTCMTSSLASLLASGCKVEAALRLGDGCAIFVSRKR